MKLYEFEGKELFREVGIPVPKGIVTDKPIKWEGKAVVKSQLLEGARGKRGLVRVTENVEETINELMKLGVNKFLVEEFIPHEKEIYLSALIDRDVAEPIIVASPEGGIDIESSKNVKIFHIPIERGVRSYDVIKIEKYLNVKGLEPIIKGLYKLVTEYDAELAEINPLAVTVDGRLYALDSKVILEDNALFRHQDLLEKIGRSPSKDAYVELDGDIGIIGNGAGLTMATMDMVKLMGGSPADFYDVGGGADREKVKEAVLKIGSNPKVKKIIINIYGGITKCDEVALGIVDAYSLIKKPIYVRLVGTNEEQGRKILQENGIKYYTDALSCIGDALRS
ncbi:succinate--CoA ligase subunit beta [Sulfurisphaera ohwakuensis]|uniref:Succinate--CoA ligase subunit beta n=1 Tax=Sulfurisphaera ohwakuensis TaxID=69656 RepID=A0A650CGH0_SULOH|nr:succinate--CoA ligase subunit beta [Sulfurisphaera ohwakuensis]MBB5252727.1 succinyl-CoA synthetase beta subunit [Sulfurisphaera ohwakuensis]QGR16856.1 succinate--CoA ligase subunit beta [Sulfurisphaera ohwakuensis]